MSRRAESPRYLGTVGSRVCYFVSKADALHQPTGPRLSGFLATREHADSILAWARRRDASARVFRLFRELQVIE